MKLNQTKILGLIWEKDKDLLAVEIASEMRKLTKRTILQKMASICDTLSIISTTTTIGKIICHGICDSRISWDKALPNLIVKKYEI